MKSDELKHIFGFTILWMMFENKVQKLYAIKRVHMAKMVYCIPNSWKNICDKDKVAFHEGLEHFQNRLFHRNGKQTKHFAPLDLKGKACRKVKKTLLSIDEPEFDDIAISMLIIINRIRNNLFHGFKIQSGLSDQLDNFAHSNNILMAAIRLTENQLRERNSDS